MRLFLIILQIFSALSLVILVLLHTAKGEGLGGIGGAARLFGSPKGLEEGLDRITATTAAVFIIVSLVLGISS